MKAISQFVSVLGLPFSNVTMDEAVAKIEGYIATGEFHQVATANVDFVSRAMSDLRLQKVLCDCEMVLPDGMPIVWASRMAGAALKERVTGADLVRRIAQLSAQKGYRIFLLGAKEDVSALAARKLEEQFPGVQIAGRYSPAVATLDEMDHDDILRRVKAAKADVLLVAFGNPKQEQWIAMHRDRLHVSVAIGIGGTLDMIAGAVDRAPEWMQNTGLEWFFRMAQEPARLAPRYLRNLRTLARYMPLTMASQRRPGRMFQNAYYLHVENAKSGSIITLRGTLAQMGAASLLEEVERATDASSVMINLAHTQHLGADGIGTLLEARRVTRARGQKFSLYGVSRSMRRAFRLAQVEQILSAMPVTQEVFVRAPRSKATVPAMAAAQAHSALQQSA